jgi:hypothetical protein
MTNKNNIKNSKLEDRPERKTSYGEFKFGEWSTSGSSRRRRGVVSLLRRSLTASLYISMAENFKMNSLSGCCSMTRSIQNAMR